MDFKSKIILIYGPTASGKSDFAIELAKKINGEIINADSMQVYKDLKILTLAKRKGDLAKIIAENKSLIKFINWKPKFSLEKGISNTIKFYEKKF